MTSNAAIRYRIAPLDPRAHLFEVRCTVADPNPAGQGFRLPSWVPGSYLIRELARHLVSVRAESCGRSVSITKESKDFWRAERCAGALTVTAQVYAFDTSVRGAYLDSRRGFFTGAAVFLCVEDLASRRCEVEIVSPGAATETPWRVATTLPRIETDANGFGLYHAADYDELIDHPVEMSDFVSVPFAAGGARHDIALTGTFRADLDRLGRDLARVCQWQCDLFGGCSDSTAPFDRYLFQVFVTGDGYGGLEHRSSTSLVCKRDELPQPGIAEVTADYRRFLGLASHEYFHAWMIKRIKPEVFMPYRLERESYTRQLWAFEGITSYYDDLALVRSGVIDVAGYLESLGRSITQLLRTPGRRVQSIAESSFDAWIKYYRQDENTPNAVVSYYVKGSLVALALDLTLRRLGSSLDDIMRALWQRFGVTGVGVPEDAIPKLCNELAQQDLGDFFARYVDGTDEIPLDDLLRSVGIRFNRRAAESASDAGGTHGKPASPSIPRSSLGARLAPGSEVKLQHVYSGGAAERAGLAAGDVLVAIDGLRATSTALPKLLARRRPGDTLAIHAFRRDELVTVRLTLDEAPLDTCWLSIDEDASLEARRSRSGWLGEASESSRDAKAKA